MSKKQKDNVLSIGYDRLGTINMAQFQEALLTDIARLTDDVGIQFLTNARLIIPITTAHGDPIALHYLTDRPMKRIDTYYYRPACLDYDV